MMESSDWRIRALLEPRGFIRFIEFILAIVAFATTGGFSTHFAFMLKCPNGTKTIVNSVTVSYPFRLSAQPVSFHFCNGTVGTTTMNGNFAPSAEWFVFVGVTAFLFSLASMIFYVMFDAKVRASNDKMVTIGDLAVTVLYAFFWLTAASAWAWGLSQVKYWTSQQVFLQNDPLPSVCSEGNTDNCSGFSAANYGSLNASVAFGFLNFFLWSCNVWFVYKESPYHQEPGKNENTDAQSSVPPNNM